MDDALCDAIGEISGQDLFLYPEPDVLDFTAHRSAKLILHSNTLSLEIPFGRDLKKTREYLGCLQLFIGGEQSVLATWNLKNFLSYVLGRTGVDFKLNGKIYDISFLESYLGKNNPRPSNFTEARQRLLNLTKNINWDNINKIYQEVYLPLILSIPKVEIYGLSHKDKKARVYSFYEIDGQVNGRMKCSNVFSSSYNPHTLTPEEKDNLRCPGFGYTFLYFDFKHMEVNILQWLSQDEKMKEILESGRDFYEAAWEILTDSSCNSERRQICKSFFLPVFYGLGVETLSKKITWPLDVCKSLINRIYKCFPIATAWMKAQQEKLENGMACDYYGRCRSFDSPYKVRNFSVQSPAALICLHKLVLLIKALGDLGNVCMYIHDGYVLSVKQKDAFKAYETTKQVLESKNELYPGLKLKADCLSGVNLNEMVAYIGG